MNPICRIDIFSPECQKWMSDVYDRCRNLFSSEPADPFAAWWKDNTPALYKCDVQAMTVYDCHKLKRSLEEEVKPETTAKPNIARDLQPFLWWQKLLLIVAYACIIGLVLIICACCRKATKKKESEEKTKVDDEVTTPTATLTPTLAQKKPQKKKRVFKNWMRHKCRPVFVHSEAELRRQQIKREKEEIAHATHTREKIEKWTKDREAADKEALRLKKEGKE